MEDFKIIIVGAGIGGLACAIALRGPGRQITIVEKSRLLRETGAGISLQPNATRIAMKWGIASELASNGGFADLGFSIYTSDGKLVNKLPFKPEEDGAARIIYHRVDLHNGLRRLATQPADDTAQGPPAELILGCGVEDCDSQAGTVTLADGRQLQADLIVAADGIRSRMRDLIAGKAIEAQPTGLSAYRMLIPVESLHGIPELDNVMDIKQPYTTLLVGHDRRLMMGPCRNGDILSIIALVPDEHMHEKSSAESWTSPGSLEDVVKSFDIFPDWCKEVFKRAPEIGLWQLRDIDPLEQWTSGRSILVGDAAHAMLPLQGQGASQTFEDAEALQAAFAEVTSKPSAQEVERRLQKVFRGRHERASLIQTYSRAAAPAAKAAPNGAAAAANLNPFQFYQYNTQYYGLEHWLKQNPALAEASAA